MSLRILSRLTSRCARARTNCSSTPSSASASNLSGSASMPLVKNGNITDDLFLHVADGAELPGDGAVLISAARFLEDPESFLRRSGKTGVIWPNKRPVNELVPYLDRLAVGGLVVSSFRCRRASSQ